MMIEEGRNLYVNFRLKVGLTVDLTAQWKHSHKI